MKNKNRIRKLEKRVSRLFRRTALMDVEKTEIMATNLLEYLLSKRITALEERLSDAPTETVHPNN